jgi:hypothetical protein
MLFVKCKLCANEELNNLYASPNIVRVIESRVMRFLGPIVCLGVRREE